MGRQGARGREHCAQTRAADCGALVDCGILVGRSALADRGLLVDRDALVDCGILVGRSALADRGLLADGDALADCDALAGRRALLWHVEKGCGQARDCGQVSLIGPMAVSYFQRKENSDRR